MLFSSFSFLFWFLPSLLALYFLPPAFLSLTRRLTRKKCVQSGNIPPDGVRKPAFFPVGDASGSGTGGARENGSDTHPIETSNAARGAKRGAPRKKERDPDGDAARGAKRSAPKGVLAWQNGVLLVGSLLFYAWGEPIYVFLMVGTILFDTLFGVLLEKYAACRPARRALLFLAVLFHLGALFYFKYAAFFAGLFGVTLATPRLPLGISFYTFQALSYIIDVARGEVKATKSPFLLGVYVALFPQLIAGPIVRYRDVARALTARRHSLFSAAAGTRRFLAGLMKKLLLANPAGALFSLLAARGASLSAKGALVALLSFAFQIYFDFSGYSDMAIGLGRVFGFRFPENFDYPYVATSITDFWRRWHITLSSFFREYVYFPLGGSRRGDLITLRNLFIVWALTGLWHGASLNFVAWGLYYFLFLALEKFVLKKLPTPPRAVRRALTFCVVLFGWLLFAFDGSAPYLTFPALGVFLGALAGRGGFIARAECYDIVRHLPTLFLAALGSTPFPRRIYRHTVRKKWGRRLLLLFPLAAFFLSLALLSDVGFNPFLYFRF